MKRLLAILALTVAVLAAWLVRRPTIETSLLALIDGGDMRVPEAVANRGAGELQVTFRAADEAMARRQAEAFLAALERAFFADVRFRLGAEAAGDGDDEFGALLTFYTAHRRGLVAEADAQRLLAGETEALVDEAEAALYAPTPQLIPLANDPCGLLQRFLQSLPMGYGAWKPTPGGYLAAPFHGQMALLMTLSLKPEIAASPQALMPAIDHLQALQARFTTPEVTISLSGVPLHTAAVAGRCRREITWLSLFSLAVIVGVAAWAFRSIRFLPAMLSVLTLSALSGALAVLLLFRSIHVLACVFATTLLGITIDYAFHGLLAQADPARTRRSLIASWLTTELAMLPLACSGIGLLTQVACFIGAGLAAALLTVCLVLLPRRQLPDTPAPAEEAPSRAPLSLPRIGALGAIAALALAPLLWATFRTDPAQLHTPAPALQQAEQDFRDLSDTHGPRAGLLVLSAPTLEALLEKEEALALPGKLPHAAAYLPSLRHRQRVANQEAALYQAAEARLGDLFESPDVLAPPPAAEPWHFDALPALLTKSFLLHEEGQYLSLIPMPELPEGPLPEGVVAYAPRRALGDFLAHCQARALQLLTWVALLLSLLLAVLFRRRAFRILLPSLLGVSAVFSTLTLRSLPINLFHLLACFMLIGMTLDYAIFLSTAPQAARKPVTCSFLTSLAGFGALACVSFTLVRSMGETFAIGLSVAYLAGRILFPIPPRKADEASAEVGASLFWLEVLWLVYRLLGATFLRAVAWCVGLFFWICSPTIRHNAGTHQRLQNFIRAMVDKLIVMTCGRGQPTILADGTPETQAFLADVAAHKGIFMVSSHLGAIEVFPAFAETDITVHAFMKFERTAIFNAFYMRHFRRKSVCIHPVTAFGIGETMAAGDALDAGDCVLMAGDAPFGRKIERAFCGRQHAFPIGTFRLARALGHPIYFVACIRLQGSTYRLIARPLPKENAERCAEAFATLLEPLVMAYPAQWYQWGESPRLPKETPTHG